MTGIILFSENPGTSGREPIDIDEMTDQQLDDWISRGMKSENPGEYFASFAKALAVWIRDNIQKEEQ